MSLAYLLIGAQAAGYGASVYAKKQSERYVRQAEELDAQQRRLQFEQESLSSLETADVNLMRLRETLATNRAVAGARGVQGSNAQLQQNLRLYNADERARQLSLSFRKAQMDTVNRLYSLKSAGRNVQRRQDRFTKGINLLNFTPLTSKLMSSFGLGLIEASPSS